VQTQTSFAASTGRKICYFSADHAGPTAASLGPTVAKIRGASYTFPNAEAVAGRRYAACIYDAAGPSFQFSGLDPRKAYRVGFSWWDFDNAGRVESVVAYGNGRTVTVVEKTTLPAFQGKNRMPVETAVFLPGETYAASSVRVEFRNESPAPNAVVGEIWLEELPMPIGGVVDHRLMRY
jgi:hypothetical protein